MRRRVGVAALAAVAAVSLSGCGVTKGLYGVPLPGGEASRGDIYRVSVIFDNVMDLVPQGAVKVDDVTVGSIEKIELTRDRKAKVTCRIKQSVALPANSVAVIQQTSLLGEKFIELGPPPGKQPQGRLTDGAVVSDGNTSAYPDVDEVFAILSTILNGGSIERLQTISMELTKALAGREKDVRNFLTQLDTMVSGLDAQKSEIVRAIDALDRLSSRLAEQKQTIDVALRDIGPGLKVLADERAQLTEMLTSLGRLGEVSTQVINASRENTVASLRAMQPVLSQLAASGQALPRSLELLLDYPFPRTATDGILGDYTNLYITLDMSSVCNLLPIPGLCDLTNLQPPSGSPLAPAKPSSPTTPGLPLPTPSLPSAPLPLPSPTLGGLDDLLGGGLR